MLYQQKPRLYLYFLFNILCFLPNKFYVELLDFIESQTLFINLWYY